MKIISHRGNLFGPDVENENRPEYIENALELGYDVEVDLWLENGQLYLGHDNPEYSINLKFIEKDNLWIHAKNLGALYLLTNTQLHYFWHQNDDFTLTSKNYIWTYPNKEYTNRSVLVTFNQNIDEYRNLDLFGICTDYGKK